MDSEPEIYLGWGVYDLRGGVVLPGPCVEEYGIGGFVWEMMRVDKQTDQK